MDDVTVIHCYVESVLSRIDNYFKLKPIFIGNPDIYLRDKLMILRLENVVWAWGKPPARYVKELVANNEKYLEELAEARWQFPKKKSENPFVRYYSQEMDETFSLEQDLASWYQSLIGMIRWMVEMVRVDIINEVSMMISQMVVPREGHLEAVLHVFSFILQKYNSSMAFDPT